MPRLPQLRFSARCPACLRVVALLPSGDLFRHAPCGTGTRPAPTLVGAELDGRTPFPEDVTEVANRNGARPHRTPEGWAFSSGKPQGLWAQAELGPYLVLAVDPALVQR